MPSCKLLAWESARHPGIRRPIVHGHGVEDVPAIAIHRLLERIPLARDSASNGLEPFGVQEDDLAQSSEGRTNPQVHKRIGREAEQGMKAGKKQRARVRDGVEPGLQADDEGRDPELDACGRERQQGDADLGRGGLPGNSRTGKQDWIPCLTLYL